MEFVLCREDKPRHADIQTILNLTKEITPTKYNKSLENVIVYLNTIPPEIDGVANVLSMEYLKMEKITHIITLSENFFHRLDNNEFDRCVVVLLHEILHIISPNANENQIWKLTTEIYKQKVKELKVEESKGDGSA